MSTSNLVAISAFSLWLSSDDPGLEFPQILTHRYKRLDILCCCSLCFRLCGGPHVSDGDPGESLLHLQRAQPPPGGAARGEAPDLPLDRLRLHHGASGTLPDNGPLLRRSARPGEKQ